MKEEQMFRGGGRIEVHRTEGGKVQVSFLDEDGGFAWFALSSDEAMNLGERICAVAIHAVDYA